MSSKLGYPTYHQGRPVLTHLGEPKLFSHPEKRSHHPLLILWGLHSGIRKDLWGCILHPRSLLSFCSCYYTRSNQLKAVKYPHPNWSDPVSSSFISDHIFVGYGKMLAQDPHWRCPMKVILLWRPNFPTPSSTFPYSF